MRSILHTLHSFIVPGMWFCFYACLLQRVIVKWRLSVDTSYIFRLPNVGCGFSAERCLHHFIFSARKRRSVIRLQIPVPCY